MSGPFNLRGDVRRRELHLDVVTLGAGAARTASQNRAIIQGALNSSRWVTFGKKQETFAIDGPIVLNSGQVLRLDGATIIQSGTNSQILNADGKTDIDIEGGIFRGIGTDFVNASQLKSGLRAIGSGKVKVRHCEFHSFADSGVIVQYADDVKILDSIFTGPGSSVLTPVTSGTCAGVIIDRDCKRVLLSGNTVSNTSQGIVTSNGLLDVVISNNHIFDIVGQHGMYCGAGHQGLVITGNTVRNTSLQGIKVQNHDTYELFADNIVISNNSLMDTGSHGILVSNTTGSIATYKLRNVEIIGNVITNSIGEGVVLIHANHGEVAHNLINGAFQGIRLSACEDIDVTHNRVSKVQRVGIRSELSVRGSISENRVTDTGLEAGAAERHGIFVASGGTDLDIDGNRVRNVAGTMPYGLFINSAEQPTIRVRRNRVRGATLHGARFTGASTGFAEYESNDFSGSSGDVMNAPTVTTLGAPRIFRGADLPTDGSAHRVGDLFIKRAPIAGQTAIFMATAVTPTLAWKALPALEA